MAKDNLRDIINNILKKIEKIENEQKKYKRYLTKNSFDDLDVKLYIKGKYIDFDEENQSLEILVAGETRYYSLENYHSQNLPFPDTMVLIFSKDGSNGSIAKIFSTNKGEINKLSTYKRFIYKGIKNNLATFYSKESAYLCFEQKEDLINKYNLKIGQSIDFRKIYWGTKIFYIPDTEIINSIKQDKLKILELIKENENDKK
ncbi:MULTISPECIES: hypothetical protein [Arcobacteraceae]|uniref:Uncharacterized protein n=2 Tax=Arcobacteraceae TaxID=2808963 RepID=A0A5C2HF77_9BACT|nr:MULTISPECIES: hypothetical protein [Arcobacteraceae]OCL81783.1 hypothetical protein AAW29_01756 [Arcobacter porcinus]OCL85427.1 hypothetical protein AAX30_01929 [Arcobacter porcinus]OCL85491.1 hypothetical protein AAX26_01917 [Aliarcobacter thereius]OCL90430.1 hypothetical protein AAX25_01521 [Aliarcobacter thereius]OCL90636.1 hypothetical protein AAX27_01445 [Aliarcobacter thereius]